MRRGRWWRGGDAGMDAASARVELARRWLLVFGPAPVADLQWWAGWTGGQTKAALAALPVREVGLDGQPGVLLAGDEDFDDGPGPVAALLPALDPTPMGWQSRDWYLGPHGPALFDRTGNIGPTVWWEGRIVGGWAQRPPVRWRTGCSRTSARTRPRPSRRRRPGWSRGWARPG